MQVAAFSSISYGYSATLSAERTTARPSEQTVRESLRVDISALYQKHSLTVREVKTASPFALAALDYIASSTRLAPEERQTLIRLVAVVDEFAGGDPKLMRDIIGIAKIMELNATETYPPKSFRETLEAYFEAREKLNASDSVQISAETEVLAVIVQYQLDQEPITTSQASLVPVTVRR